MIKFKRQNLGRAKTRFGILLSPLKPRHRKILLDNPILKKNSNDDRFLNCIFSLEDSKMRVSHNIRPYLNRKDKSVSTFMKSKEINRFLDWNCAYCRTEIKSEINNYEPENFVCEKCYNYYIKNSKFVNERIIDSSVKFTDQYKRKLKEEQLKFLKYIRKNAS
jgi:hypothetical protein